MKTTKIVYLITYYGGDTQTVIEAYISEKAAKHAMKTRIKKENDPDYGIEIAPIEL